MERIRRLTHLNEEIGEWRKRVLKEGENVDLNRTAEWRAKNELRSEPEVQKGVNNAKPPNGTTRIKTTTPLQK